ncbi:MAG: hypothetical protein EA339_08940 [Rhodobacteraceae bacterium]|nr:MAG: hypothetical protein EA339_08940 [Paracoccaceae bacterium]
MLHIGAHKTASTYLQKLCLANAGRLAAQGCLYLGPERLRRDLVIPSLDRPAPVLRRKTALLRRLLTEARATGMRALLSNENTIGGPRPPIMACGTQLYPKAESHVSALLDALDLEGVTLCLALRDPLGLLVSAWGHQYLAGRPVAFDDFIAEVAPEALRWSELVARLLTCERVARVHLWQFEAFHGKAPALVRALAGLPDEIALNEPPEHPGWTYLIGPSARALTSLPRVMRHNPELSAKDALRRAMRRYPKSSAYPGPQPFTHAQIAASGRRYAQDLAAIADLPGVTCLQP